MRAATVLATALLWLPLGWAQPAATPAPWQRMLASQSDVREQLLREARRLTFVAGREIGSKSTWEPLREQRRREMLDMLGLQPLPPRTPLNVQITGIIEGSDYRIEKIAFESLPKVYVTANLYIPNQRDGPLPAVIYVCGHAFSAHGNKTAYQRHPITLARHGYVALIIDSIQIAETFALHHGVYNNEMYDWYARGYTPAGVEVWNVMRALDYLETRPEVDQNRFGITGRSGGAAMSWFAASVDPRIKVAVPVMGISTYAANIAEDTQRLHCDCMFVINTYLHDMLHQGALIAPRPLYMMHGRQDALFPVKGYQEFEQRVGELYASYGAHERFKNLEVDGGHEDSGLLRGEAVRWFDLWLKQIPERPIDLAYTDLPPERLAVFGGNPPPDAQNYRVHEFFTAGSARRDYPDLGAWRQRRAALLQTLRRQVFRALGDPGGPAPALAAGTFEAPEGFETLQFDSEPSIPIQVLYRQAPEAGGPALLYIASDGENWAATRDTLRPVLSSRRNSLMIVYPRGVGEVPWDKQFWKGTLRNAMQLGRTVDSMRLWDVIQAAQALRQRAEPGAASELVTAGIGVSGALGLYAALLDDQISQVILIHPPVSHRQGPVFLNVLRYTDLPEAAALLAPRRLTFYGHQPDEYGYTQTIYNLFPKPGHLSLTMSLEAALNGRHDHNFASGL